MSLLFFKCFIKLVFILILININLITGQITYNEFCNEINTSFKISCFYPSGNQIQNTYYSFNGNYSQITNSSSSGYTITNSGNINYLEINNLNTRDRKIVSGTGTTSSFIRCEYKINLFGNYYFNLKVKYIIMFCLLRQY